MSAQVQKKITLQDVFDAGVKAFIVQNRGPCTLASYAAREEDSPWKCAYQRDDGNHCAFGWTFPAGHRFLDSSFAIRYLIEDDMSSPEEERIFHKNFYEGPGEWNGVQLDLHDRHVKADNTFNLDGLVASYLNVAYKYKLDPTILRNAIGEKKYAEQLLAHVRDSNGNPVSHWEISKWE